MKKSSLYWPWLVSLVSTLGSLFFSNIMNFPPCTLCWWQRIFMFPLVFIFGVAFVRKDENGRLYGLPLIIGGLLVSIYHNLLYYKLIETSIVPCTVGVSCTSKQIEWLGFITIPFLSMLAFVVLFTMTIKLKDKTHE